MAGLLVAQEIAGAAKIEIVARDREAGAQIVQRLQHLKAALRGVGELLVDGRREIGVGALLGAADAAAQLIELRQTELIGAMHDQRVRGRNVEAGFDDVGRDEHVDLAVVERGHRLFEPRGADLAVRRRGLHLGHSLLEELERAAEIGDARHDIEALPAAIVLAQQRLADGQRIERRHVGAHGEAIDRRRGDERKIAHARERQLQRARDGRRGQRQHMDVGLQALQPLLVRRRRNAAPRPRSGGRDRGTLMPLASSACVPMTMSISPDATFSLISFASFGGVKRDSCAMRTGKPVEAFGEGAVMLARQQRGRHDDRHLRCPTSPSRRPRAAPPRSCRSRHRRRRGDPSAGPWRDPRSRRRWRVPDPRSRHRGSARRIRRRGPRAFRPPASVSSRARRRCGSARPPSRARAPSCALCGSASPRRRACRAGRPLLRSRSASEARCSRRAGTACRRHIAARGNRAARPRRRGS